MGEFSVTVNAAGAYAGNTTAGHMWITLNDGNGNSKSYGYYGDGSVKNNDSPSRYVDQTQVKSREIGITEQQYNDMKNFADNPGNYGFGPDDYNVLDNSCVDFSWRMLEFGGLNPNKFEGMALPGENWSDMDRIGDPDDAPGFDWLRDWRPDRVDWDLPPRPIDPLAFDLDGDGLKLISVQSSNAYFDYNGDGFAEKTGWLEADDGFLFRDIDGDGVASGITELFGNATQDGYTMLAVSDTNGDGKIDSQDSIFGTLGIWRDLNGDGISTANEVSTLVDFGITAIGLERTVNGNVVNGNEIQFSGTVTTSNGSTLESGALLFATNTLLTKWTPPPGTVIPPAVAALPGLQGYGTIVDFDFAMMNNSLLENMVTSLVGSISEENATTTRGNFYDILYEWADVSDVSPVGRAGTAMDARRIAFLEEFFGAPIEGSIDGGYASVLNARFEQVATWYLVRFASQVPQIIASQLSDPWIAVDHVLAPLAKLEYSIEADSFAGNLATVCENIVRSLPADTADAKFALSLTLPLLKALFRDTIAESSDEFLISLKTVFERIESPQIRLYAAAILDADKTIFGTDAADIVAVTSLDPTFQPSSLDDLIVGGKGDDQLAGATGNDTYIYNNGDGTDTITEFSSHLSIADVLQFTGHGFAELTIEQSNSNNDLILAFNSTSDQITIVGGQTTQNQQIAAIEYLTFSNGTTLTMQQALIAKGFAPPAYLVRNENHADGNGLVDGSYLELSTDPTNMVFYGGTINLTLRGGSGNDTYVVSASDGHVTIDDQFTVESYQNPKAQGLAHDALILSGNSFSEFTFEIGGIEGLDLILKRNGIEVIRILDEFNASHLGFGSGMVPNNDGVEVIVDTDGATLSRFELARLAEYNGTSGDDIMRGLFFSRDHLALPTYYNSERYRGGLGNDEFNDRNGSDTYYYKSGDGNDMIYDFVDDYDYDFSKDVDTLVLENLTQSQVRFEVVDFDFWPAGADLPIPATEVFLRDITTGQTISLIGNLLDQRIGVEKIVFSDGTMLSRADIQSQATRYGTQDADELSGPGNFDGGAGDDTIQGSNSSAVKLFYRAGDGNDDIKGVNSIQFKDLSSTQVTISRVGDGLVFTVAGSNETITESGYFSNADLSNANIKTVVFSDGVVFTQQDIIARVAAVNSAPVVAAPLADQQSPEDQAFAFPLPIGTFTDPQEDVLAFSATLADGTELPSWVSINAQTGEISGTPPQNFTGSVDIKIIASDGEFSVSDVFTLNITPVNDAPISFADGTFVAARNSVVNIAAATLLSNDVDVDGDALTISFVGNAVNGTVSLLADGSVAFTPGEDYIGLGSFTYTVVDLSGAASTATVNLNLTSVAGQTINGTSAANTLVGTAADDTIYGLGGNDTLNGNGGVDVLIGGAGNDTYIVDSAGDRTNELAGEGTDLVQSSTNWLLSANIENLTLTGTANISGSGNELANIITGNTGNNRLDGGLGADRLVGGTGDDIYVVDDAGDVTTEAASAGIDSVYSSISWTLATNLENLYLTGTNNLNATGNTVANTIVGNSGNNTLNGGSGADSMTGKLGDDVYILDNVGDAATEQVGEGIDTVRSSVTVALASNLENLVLTGTSSINGTGNELSNSLAGNIGNNILNGGLGVDTMTGGLGNDTYVVDSSGDTVVENASEGTDTVQSAVTWVLGDNLENLTLTGIGDLNATGNAAANVLTGNAGNNVLDGSLGADIMIGGLGNDSYNVDHVSDVTTEAATAGNDRVYASLDWTLASNLENLYLIGSNHLNGTGNTLANTIIGNSGDNILNGGGGADTMFGGLGDDTFDFDNLGDLAIEQTGGGIDTVRTSVAITLAANLENLVLTGTAAIAGSGNELNNNLTGNTANNTLNGGLGADTLAGGLGNDIYVVDNLSDTIVENVGDGTDTVQAVLNWTLGDNIENLTLTGTADLSGIGNSSNNTLTGNTGNNILDGGIGTDIMVGGLGNDTYYVDNSGDITTEASSAGTDVVYSNVNWTLATNLEHLVLSGSATNGTGNTLANTITGNALNNTLNGGTGADSLIGGLGDDVYVVDNIGDVVTEQSAEGSDTVQSSIAYTLASNVENLALSGTGNINGTGNSLANVISGTIGSNRLSGFDGDDTLIGGAGNDILLGGSGVDTFVFASGFGKDTISDFQAGLGVADVINVSLGTAFDSYAEVMAAATQVGANTVITIDAANTITLTGVLKANLAVDDFSFT